MTSGEFIRNTSIDSFDGAREITGVTNQIMKVLNDPGNHMEKLMNFYENTSDKAAFVAALVSLLVVEHARHQL